MKKIHVFLQMLIQCIFEFNKSDNDLHRTPPLHLALEDLQEGVVSTGVTLVTVLLCSLACTNMICMEVVITIPVTS